MEIMNKIRSKRIITLLLAFVMVIGLASTAFAAFTDIPAGHWSEDYVNNLSERGIISGRADDTFGPNDPILRQHVAKMIALALELELGDGTTAFDDVQDGNEFAKYIAATNEAGIFKGVSADEFGWGNNITRRQIASVIVRAFDLEMGPEEVKFEDIEEIKDLETKENIKILASNGIVQNTEKFNPNGNATRAQFAKMLVEAEAVADKEPEVLEVVSVSAINGLEFQVTFSKPVSETDAETNFSTLVKLDTVIWSGAELSEDGLVLTLTTATPIDVENVTLIVEPVESADYANDELKSEKYVSLFTYKDTVAPSVVKNEGKDKSAEITFDEKLFAPISAGTGVSVDGVNYTNFTVDVATGKVLTINGLENGKTYKVEIVGAKDTAGNVANPINLTVAPVKPGEEAKQDVTITASGNKVTLTFVNAVTDETVDFDPNNSVGQLTLDGTNTYSEAVEYSTDKKTVTIDAQLLGVMGGLNFQETKVTVDVKEVGVDLVEKTVTLTADKTAPKLVSSKVINTTTDGKKLELNFDREVLEPTDIDLTITHIDGIRQASEKLVSGLDIAYAVDAASKSVKTTLVVDLDTDSDTPGTPLNNFEDEKSYTVKVAEDAVTDVYTNGIVESTTTFTVPKQGTAVADPKAIITVTVDDTTHNTIKLAFDKELTNVSAANFTLAGKALPTGTVVEFVTDKKNVEITLPAGSIVTSGDYVLTIANVADAAGNTLDPDFAKHTVTLGENVAPTVKSVTTPASNKVVVTFSEGVTGSLSGVTLKINGTVVTPAAGSAVSGTTLTLNLETVNELKTGDKVSVEFKDSDIVDINKNKLADVIVTN